MKMTKSKPSGYIKLNGKINECFAPATSKEEKETNDKGG